MSEKYDFALISGGFDPVHIGHLAMIKDANNLEEMIKMTKAYSKKEKIIKKGEKMVITAGLPLKKLGTTNLIRVIKID